MADTNASTATLTVETAEPVTLLTLGALGDAAQIYCVASFTQMDWAQNSRAAIQNGDGATIARYASLHVIPNEVKVDGDHVGPADNDEPFATAYTDDGHEGAICRFELNKLRVVASQ